MNIADAIAILEKETPDPALGLPEEIFLYISRTTPLVNVDLLIKDQRGRTLLSWRDDKYCGRGWHLPGGIVRFKETLESRIKKVAELEIGSPLAFEPAPLAVNQMIHNKTKNRCHFISFLYRCSLPDNFAPLNKGLCDGDQGFLKWHEICPDKLLEFHDIFYRKFI